MSNIEGGVLCLKFVNGKEKVNDCNVLLLCFFFFKKKNIYMVRSDQVTDCESPNLIPEPKIDRFQSNWAR